MLSLSVNLRLPRELLGVLDVPQTQLEYRLKEIIALQLFQDGRISSGKGAEIMGISKLEFIRLLDRHGVSYFRESSGELEDEINMLKDMFVKSDQNILSGSQQ